MIDSRFQEALDYIYSFVDYETQRRPRDAVNYDLRRVEQLLSRLGDPHRIVRSIHIAGSKGKGSTAAMIASVLISAGYNTGLYISPHLLTFNERVRVNNRLISDDEVCDLVDMLKPEVEAVNRKATYGRLTTFEVITALGFSYFARKGCDVNVVEVGLGGRLDATNVITPEVSVITSISLEHTDVLGNTLTDIAAEKAGIIKPGVPVVCSPQDHEVDRVIEKAARDAGARLVRVGRDVLYEGLEYDSARQSLRFKGLSGTYDLTIPLLGEYQLDNAAATIAALEVMTTRGYHIPTEAMRDGLARVDWPGRLQVLMRHPFVVADGAHNPYSAAKLKEALKKYFTFEHATLIIGTSADKDIGGIVEELAPVFDRVIVTRSIHPRALAAAILAGEFRRHGVEAEVTDDISIALPMALRGAEARDLICVTGSLFVVAGAIDQAGKLGLTA